MREPHLSLLKCATFKLFCYTTSSIFEGRLSSTAVCPVVDELFPLSLCPYFPAETDTVLLFSWARCVLVEHKGTGPLAVFLAAKRQPGRAGPGRRTVSWSQVTRGWFSTKNRQKDDPLLTGTISSILRVATSQCPLA